MPCATRASAKTRPPGRGWRVVVSIIILPLEHHPTGWDARREGCSVKQTFRAYPPALSARSMLGQPAETAWSQPNFRNLGLAVEAWRCTRQMVQARVSGNDRQHGPGGHLA